MTGNMFVWLVGAFIVAMIMYILGAYPARCKVCMRLRLAALMTTRTHSISARASSDRGVEIDVERWNVCRNCWVDLEEY